MKFVQYDQMYNTSKFNMISSGGYIIIMGQKSGYGICCYDTTPH